MGIKVKALERKLAFKKDEKGNDVYAYCMQPVLYSQLSQDKVIAEASLRSGMAEAVMAAAYSALSAVIKAWATEGHSVVVPGLGIMRFGLRAKSVEKVEDVGPQLINCRRVIFTPSVDIKQELANTSISITCIDRNGKVVKNVSSTDPGKVEEPDNTNPGGDSGSGSGSGSGSSSGSSSGSGSDGGQGSGSGTGSGSDGGQGSGSGTGSGSDGGQGSGSGTGSGSDGGQGSGSGTGSGSDGGQGSGSGTGSGSDGDVGLD